MMMPALVTRDHRLQRRGQVLMVLSAIAWSTTGIFQRELTVNTVTQVVGRALFALLAISAYLGVTQRNGVLRAFRAIGRAGLASTACMIVASVAFIVALNHTSVAHVLIIIAVAPILASLMGRVVLGEPIARLTWVAMLMSLGGVALMVGTSTAGSSVGDAIAVVMSVGYATNVVIMRRHREVSMAPAAVLSQVVVVLAGVPFARFASVGVHDLVFLMLLGAGSMGLGLIFIIAGARLIPVTDVMLISLLEIVLGPLGVWLVFSQQPGATTLVGGAIVLAAVGVHVVGNAHPERAGVVGVATEP